MKKRNVILASLAVCGAGLFLMHNTSLSQTSSKPAEIERKTAFRPVPTTEVVALQHTRTRTFPGVVQARSRADLAFPVAGLLQVLNAQEGTKVNKGDVIAKVDQRDFQHAYDASKANYQQAKSELKRTTILKERGIVPQAEFDNVKSVYSVAESEMRIRRKALDDSVLLAPFDGVIAKRYVENHGYIKAKDPVIAFKDISQIDVVIQVPETLIAHGGPDKFLNLLVKFDVDRSSWYEGTVKEYSVQSDRATRTYQVTVSLEPPSSVDILPGMTATVKMETPLKATSDGDGTLVPVEAVFGGSDGNSYAWVIPEMGGQPKKVQVQLGALQDEGVQVLGGLEVGQQVAVAGVHSIREDLQVRPFHKKQTGLDG